MFLSQLVMNPLNWKARTDLSNPYELHRSLMRGFPSPLDPQERVLFRLDINLRHSGQGAKVLVQSIFSPDWSPLVNKDDYLLQEPEVRSLDGLRFIGGQVLRFRLRANPSKRIAKSGRRAGIYQEEDRRIWLKRKADQSGFDFAEDALIVHEAEFHSFKAHKERLNNPSGLQNRVINMTVNIVDYEGLLQVIDPDGFYESLKEGIGPAKGLGCGLLSVARVSSY